MSAHKPYQGHRNWNAWNVALWLFNDEPVYRMMVRNVRNAATLGEATAAILGDLPAYSIAIPTDKGTHTTPDGAPFNYTNVRLALQHWDK